MRIKRIFSDSNIKTSENDLMPLLTFTKGDKLAGTHTSGKTVSATNEGKIKKEQEYSMIHRALGLL